MSLLADVLILGASLIILDQASSLTIRNTVKVSEATSLRTATLGFTLLAVSTSLPELSVTAFSAAAGEVGIAVGNVLGSNIANVCVVLGVPAIVASLKKVSPLGCISCEAAKELGSLSFGLLIASLVPLSLVYLSFLGTLIGVPLLAVFLVYSYYLFNKGITPESVEAVAPQKRAAPFSPLVPVALALLGVAGALVSSNFIVGSAANIAEALGVPRTVIGATIIAVGTSLPELSLNYKACNARQPGLALGNTIGSCFTNITLILGVIFLFSPLRINFLVFMDLVIFSLISNLLLWYFLTVGRLGSREGLILTFVYVAFLATILGVIQVSPPPSG
ncbi:MAG: hypothetical protein QW057_07330 [Candidatus Bathyarchaeia archaeon]